MSTQTALPLSQSVEFDGKLNEMLVGVAGVLMLLAFAYVDICQSHVVVIPALYVAVIVVGLLAHSPSIVAVFGLLAGALTIVGFQLSAPGIDVRADILNRGVSLIAIAVTALGSYLLLRGQARYNSHLQELAEKDALTGVANRRGLMHEAQRRFAEARRYNLPLSALLVDIDHFKSINDAHGHLVGDHVLQAVSNRCASKLRQSDFLGRYGGEEFVITCPNTASDGARRLSERLRSAVSELSFMGSTGPFGVTISVGTASLGDLIDIAEVEQLLEAADRALYRAKANGRNRVESEREPQTLRLATTAAA